MNWQQGYAPPNSDRREGVLRRKRLEYLDCVSQYYDIPDTERSDDEINMLRQVRSSSTLISWLFWYVIVLPYCPFQISVDCPRTVPDVTFFQQVQVQKSLERVLYTWLATETVKVLKSCTNLETRFLLESKSKKKKN